MKWAFKAVLSFQRINSLAALETKSVILVQHRLNPITDKIKVHSRFLDFFPFDSFIT